MDSKNSPSKKRKSSCSPKRQASPRKAKMVKWLVWGGERGWIGGQVCEILRARGHEVHAAKARMEEREHVAKELDNFKPDYVVNAAGVTGRPNVDWCEDHKQETVRANMIGQLNLLDLCHQRNIPIVNFATGCIYKYDDEHPLGSGVGFKEEDDANFFGSWYSTTKGMIDKVVRATYPNALHLRIRMPLSDDLSPRNFITKITNYAKVVNIPNSMTVLHEFVPLALDMVLAGLRGTYNFTNPGVISHNEILDLYKKYIDPKFTYVNFTEEEQAKILKAGRSNNELDTTKLVRDCKEKVGHEPESIKTAIVKLFERMQKNLAAQKKSPAKSPKKPMPKNDECC